MKAFASCLIALVLAGCEWLPAAGPTKNSVIGQAKAEGQLRFNLIDVNDQVVDTLLSRPAESFRTVFGQYGLPPVPTIVVGDSVVVSTWEGGTGTLFGETLTLDHAMTTGARRVTIPKQIVPRDGEISAPFAASPA